MGFKLFVFVFYLVKDTLKLKLHHLSNKCGSIHAENFKLTGESSAEWRLFAAPRASMLDSGERKIEDFLRISRKFWGGGAFSLCLVLLNELHAFGFRSRSRGLTTPILNEENILGYCWIVVVQAFSLLVFKISFL